MGFCTELVVTNGRGQDAALAGVVAWAAKAALRLRC